MAAVGSLRFDGETDAAFRRRAERAATVAKLLIKGCLENECMQRYIADPALPMHTAEAARRSPTVRVEYEQAIAIGGIGETLAATKSKHWGEGPFILPLDPQDEFFADRITYVYRANSLYNRRFEQRKRLKELLGRRYRPLVEAAKYKRHTKKMFLESLTADQANAIRRILGVAPGEFWRACRGTRFLDLPPRQVQLELPFSEAESTESS